MDTIDEKIVLLSKRFGEHREWEEKYKDIIAMGKELEQFPEEFRNDQYKVKGCQSQVWLYPELKNGKIHFYGDSDASIVKGVIAVLLRVYSDSSVEEILSTRPSFIDDIGLRQHLSMSRANGLNSMIKQIGLYALAFKAKLAASEMGK